MTSLALGSSTARVVAPLVEETRPRTAEQRLRAMFDTHHDGVWRSLRRLGVREDQVDDATQQVFLVAARRLGDIVDGGEKHFLYGVALRVASEHRRRDPSLKFPVADHALDSLVDETLAVDDLLIEREARAVLDDVLSAMPDDLRQPFVLVELEGMSLAEVATIVGVPVGTATSRLRRAREAFSEGARRVRARLARGGR